MKVLKFYKDPDHRWFVELPEWKGEKDDLEMVMGADTMLDYMSPDENEIHISFSTESFDNYQYELTAIEEIYDGCSYKLKSKNIEFDIWLCEVTKFVFGYYPNKLYLK